jgi:hypothetical protein
MDRMLAKTLWRWAKDDESRIAQLEGWLNEAITQIAAGNGQSIQSATGNGVSVNMASNGMTNSAWAATVSQALEFITSPPTSRIGVRIV